MLTNGFGGTFHLHNTLDDKVGYNAVDHHSGGTTKINGQQLAGDLAA